MQIGTVAALYRYPVKAMAGESLDAAEVGFHGLAGDRRYAFVQSEDHSDFPWLTVRQLPRLLRYAPAGGDEPVVRTPDGRELPVRSAELAAELAEALGAPVHVHRDHRGTQDAFPVSLLSLQTVTALSALAGRELTAPRFRPSIVIDSPGGADFPEDELVGHTVALGDEARVRVDQRDARCMVINFDPATAERDPGVLRAVARHRDACLGVYGSCERPGVVRVGDPVVLDA
jgi:uncharacterized protein YcbX